jgi:hypothetical protein
MPRGRKKGTVVKKRAAKQPASSVEEMFIPVEKHASLINGCLVRQATLTNKIIALEQQLAEQSKNFLELQAVLYRDLNSLKEGLLKIQAAQEKGDTELGCGSTDCCEKSSCDGGEIGDLEQ